MIISLALVNTVYYYELLFPFNGNSYSSRLIHKSPHMLDEGLAAFWILLSISTLIICSFQQSNTLWMHGKLRNGINKTILSKLLSMDAFLLPKSFFSHMYVTGIISGMLVYWITNTSGIKNYRSIQIFLMFEFHVIRRLVETKYITSYGDSKIHVSAYFVAIVHYIIVPLTLFNNSYAEYDLPSSLSFLLHATSIILFLYGNYYQYKLHLILYNLKTNNNKNNTNSPQVYKLPVGLWFQNICCPHYFAEIIIYSRFLLLKPFKISLLCLLLWVVINLSIVANTNYNWYKKQFKDTIPKNWYRIIPGIY
jgi:3-oxo-5-alpha-steroid 4-dehydrogenase 3